jgi:hypothetical protein
MARPPVHVRETATPTSLLVDGHPPGSILVDCSCGDSYLVVEGGDEYGRLNAAQAAHAAGGSDR